MGLIFKVDLSGIETFKREFGRSVERVNRDMKYEMQEAGLRIYDWSQYYVPVDTNELRTSGELVTLTSNKKQFIYALRYGHTGPSRKYAFWVEVREYAASGKKVFHAPPTRAWYVRTAHEHIKDEMKNALKNVIENFKRKHKKSR